MRFDVRSESTRPLAEVVGFGGDAAVPRQRSDCTQGPHRPGARPAAAGWWQTAGPPRRPRLAGSLVGDVCARSPTLRGGPASACSAVCRTAASRTASPPATSVASQRPSSCSSQCGASNTTGKPRSPSSKHWPFKYDGQGTGTLKVDGKVVDTQPMPKTLPTILQWEENFDIGSDTLAGANDADHKAAVRIESEAERAHRQARPTADPAGRAEDARSGDEGQGLKPSVPSWLRR